MLIKGTTLILAVLICVVGIFAVREYLSVIFGNDEGPISKIIKIISYSVTILLIIGACSGSWEILFLFLAMNLIALSIFVVARFATNQGIFGIISKQILGILYIPVSLSLLIFVKELPGGTFWIIWLLIVISANDAGAFYSGTFLGKKVLSPAISPNKTVEGSLGGIVTAMIAGFIFCLIFFGDLGLAFLTIPGSFMLAIAGQIGDLFESAMKRAARMKDSGKLLPGHGGMLDRIDGLLFGIPVLYLYLAIVI